MTKLYTPVKTPSYNSTVLHLHDHLEAQTTIIYIKKTPILNSTVLYLHDHFKTQTNTRPRVKIVPYGIT